MKTLIMIRLLSFVFFSLVTVLLSGQNQVPEITNLQASIAGSELMISYDLADRDNDDIEITLRVSGNSGQTFDINTGSATGDIGFPVNPGTGKMISWDFSSEISMSGNYRIMLVADDREEVDIQEIVDQVDSVRLRNDLSEIVGVRHRIADPMHLDVVRDMIRQRFIGFDLETSTLRFNYSGFEGQNIVGRKTGISDEKSVYIIDGHYDSVDDSPGADDNGSAIAGMLEALRVLAPYQFRKSIKFVGFDLEEAGLVGSGNFVNVNGIAPYETIDGVFNLEMIGYFEDGVGSQTLPAGFEILFPEAFAAVANGGFRGNFITNVGIVNHPMLNEAFAQAAAKYIPELRVISILAPEQWLALTPDLGRSDHAPFWLADMPALMLTDGSNFRNPYYHTPNDKLETINFTFMSQVVKATVAAVAELAGVSHSSSASTDVNIVTSTNELSDCGVAVYPNPIVDRIYMDLSGCITSPAELELFTINGGVVLSRSLDPSISGIDIPTAGFSPGTYILVIRSAQGIFHEKLILGR